MDYKELQKKLREQHNIELTKSKGIYYINNIYMDGWLIGSQEAYYNIDEIKDLYYKLENLKNL